MSNPNELSEDQVMELLAGRVLGGLSPEESELLDALLSSKTAAADTYGDAILELERTAAAIQLALLERPVDRMPEALQNRLRSKAPEFVSPGINSVPLGDATLAQRVTNLNSGSIGSELGPQESVQLRRKSIVSGREILAWLAFAASLFVSVGLWYSKQPSETLPVTGLREQLLAKAPDLVQVAWKPGTTPFDTDVDGDVVWSNSNQSGYMRFVGMPINDRLIEQYQLWIIDPARDDEPVDGGVFDITSSGEVVVPINAKLVVLEPAAFAITIEKPGGVVVSTQERLPLLAALR